MNEPAPIPRRIFLGAAAAAAATASLALAAGGSPLRAAASPLGLRPMGDSPNASPDGTTIPSATSITDNGGAVWTVSGAVIYRNGSTVGNTYNVSVLLWYGGMIYHSGTGGQWYVCLNDVWLPVTDPRIPLSAPAGMMYGVNTHYDTALSPTEIVAAMGALGTSVLRVNTGGGDDTISRAATIAAAVTGAGRIVFPVIDAGLQDGNGNLAYSSEAQAQSAAKDIAVRVATAMAPLGVTMYECGNELTRDPLVVADDHTGDAGTKAIDWDNSTWPIMRGFMRGLIAGIKQVQPSAKCGINFCRSDIAAADALWDGMQPDGSGGHPTVRWDITTWHNYQVDGDLFRIGTDGAGPSFNLPIYAKARYGTPFMVTEWNSNENDDLSHRASYIPAQLAEFRAARTTVGVQSAMFYSLDQGAAWGLTEGDGTPLDPPYSAYQDDVFAHPDAAANPAPIGSTISLRASNGLFVSARKQDDGTAPLQAVASVVDTWERFTVVDAGGGLIALQAQANGRYVSAWQATAGAPLTAAVAAVADWESFRWVAVGGGQVGLVSYADGQFASARQDTANTPVMANAPRLQGWETFAWAAV